MLYSALLKIKTKRLEKNLSQYNMAESLNITQGYYNKLENGKKELSAKTLFQILEILEMDLEELKPASKNQKTKQNL